MTPGATGGGFGLLSRRQTLLAAGLAAACWRSGPTPSHAKALPVVPTRGVNVPGWFDTPDGIAPDPAVLAELRRCGVASIRLPVDGELVLGGGAAMLRHIRAAVSDLVEAGFAVLVDMHPSATLHAAFLRDPAAAGDRVEEAWTALRDVIADLPAGRVYPELLNEPPMEQGHWLALRDRLAETVRAACPDHAIVWGPTIDQGIWRLEATPPLADDNQIAAVHFYAPMAFTHQCQSWGASPLARIRHLPFPATRDTARMRERLLALRGSGEDVAAALLEEQLSIDWTAAAIRAEFDRAARWSQSSGCPVMLNEFGVLDFCVDAESRLAWVRAVRSAAEANGIGWAYWELDQGFGFIESRRSTRGFDTAMVSALFEEARGGGRPVSGADHGGAVP
jgi:endoglucanase